MGELDNSIFNASNSVKSSEKLGLFQYSVCYPIPFDDLH